MTMPHPWGHPVIDARGTVYIHSQTGHFFALEDSGGYTPKVASVFETGAAGVGCSSPALAPGLMTLTVMDAMHVWQWSSHQEDTYQGYSSWKHSDVIARTWLTQVFLSVACVVCACATSRKVRRKIRKMGLFMQACLLMLFLFGIRCLWHYALSVSPEAACWAASVTYPEVN